MVWMMGIIQNRIEKVNYVSSVELFHATKNLAKSKLGFHE
jgi:hypothetical protein